MWPFNREPVSDPRGVETERPDAFGGANQDSPKTSTGKSVDQVNDLSKRRGNDSMAATWAQLLEPFSDRTKLPPKARTEPNIPQIEHPPMTLSKLWQYLPFLAVQGGSLAKSFVNHHLYGPPKPSWGVELTLFTSLLREVAAYSHLSSLARLRSVVDLAPLLPTPKDGIVTPVSFRVKKRGLRGFLAEADAAEDGKRELTGEWVINKKLWRRMQTEFATKKTVAQDARVILYLHGGAYYIMSAETHRFLTISISRYTESRVFAINYRLAPETRFPGQLHDAVASYMRLIIDLKVPPENIIFAGDSAGGGLCLATLMYLRDEGYPLPSGCILQSPWVDLTMSCESWSSNRAFDYLPSPKQDDPFNPVKCLLGAEGITKYLTHPYVSPLFGNFDKLPPMLIQAGDAEVLRDEITLLAHKASLAGVSVEHEIFEDCVHVFQAFLFLEASRKAFQSQRHFVKHKLPKLNRPKSVNFAEIDADITADAHQVNERGQADATSLPSSPRVKSDKALAEEDDVMESSGEQSEDFSDSERDSEQNSPEPSPAVNAPDPQLKHNNTPLMTTPMVSPGLPHQHHTTVRPILRAYASARDLAMSKPMSRSSTKGSEGATAASGSSTITPSQSRRHSRSLTSGLISLQARNEESKPIHAKISSHPDLRALLEEFEQEGVWTTPPKGLRTRVYGPTASGHATPPEAVSGKPVEIVAEPDSEEDFKSTRRRAPSFQGDSPGFGFV